MPRCASQQNWPPMAEMGQERTPPLHLAMSALPPKADKAQTCWLVRFVPKGDIRIAANLFDHLVGAYQKRLRNREPERSRGLEGEHDFPLGATIGRVTACFCIAVSARMPLTNIASGLRLTSSSAWTRMRSILTSPQ